MDDIGDIDMGDFGMDAEEEIKDGISEIAD